MSKQLFYVAESILSSYLDGRKMFNIHKTVLIILKIQTNYNIVIHRSLKL